MEDKSKQEMLKTVILLCEMVEDGFIAPQEAIVKAVQEGMKIAQAVYNEKDYKSSITYKEGA